MPLLLIGLMMGATREQIDLFIANVTAGPSARYYVDPGGYRYTPKLLPPLMGTRELQVRVEQSPCCPGELARTIHDWGVGGPDGRVDACDWDHPAGGYGLPPEQSCQAVYDRFIVAYNVMAEVAIAH